MIILMKDKSFCKYVQENVKNNEEKKYGIVIPNSRDILQSIRIRCAFKMGNEYDW